MGKRRAHLPKRLLGCQFRCWAADVSERRSCLGGEVRALLPGSAPSTHLYSAARLGRTTDRLFSPSTSWSSSRRPNFDGQVWGPGDSMVRDKRGLEQNTVGQRAAATPSLESGADLLK